jgi:hypothetical protein
MTDGPLRLQAFLEFNAIIPRSQCRPLFRLQVFGLVISADAVIINLMINKIKNMKKYNCCNLMKKVP